MKFKIVFIVFLVLAVPLNAQQEEAKTAGCPVAGDPSVTDILEKALQKHKVPALAGAVVTSKGLEMAGVAGVRKKGTDVAVTLDDKWHLGSDTKAMTAAMIAVLVEKGKLEWDTTVADMFSESSESFHEKYKPVTIVQLLSHRAGLPANLEWARFTADAAPVERTRAVQEALAKPPYLEPGTKNSYSNMGYIIAGAIIEKVTGEPWQKSMIDNIFNPLDMKSVGFGGTGTPGKVDQPWSHHAHGLSVEMNGPDVDNPPVMGPAGRVHCTIQDWAKFIADLLRGLQKKPSLLKHSSYEKLTAPVGKSNFALGWMATNREWAGGTVLNHAGSNTVNYAVAWVAFKRDFAVLVCTNQGGDIASRACDEVVGALIGLQIKRLEKQDELKAR